MNCCLNGEAISLLMQCKNGPAICSRSIHLHYGESDMAFTYGNHKCIRATVIFVRKHHKTPLAKIDRLRSSMPSYLHCINYNCAYIKDRVSIHLSYFASLYQAFQVWIVFIKVFCRSPYYSDIHLQYT